jgi:hypothetical protein
MPSEPKWTPEEDQLMLSFVDGEKVVNCNKVAKLMNEQAPLLGIDIRTYFPEEVHKRLHYLLKARYRYLLPPLKVIDASDFNLGLKGNQLNPVQDGSGHVQPPAPRTEPEARSRVPPQELNQLTERGEDAKLEKYGGPELYEALFPQLDRKHEADEEHEWYTERELHEEHDLSENKEDGIGEQKNL